MIKQEYTGSECETTFAAAAAVAAADAASDSLASAASAVSAASVSAASAAFANAASAADDECAPYNSKQCVIESSLLAQVNGC